MGISKEFTNYLTNEIIMSESKYVLTTDYLHLHENDISENLEDYHLLEYLYRFMESIPELKEDLLSLTCCFSFEEKSRTGAKDCRKDTYYSFEFTNFKWSTQEEFFNLYTHYSKRPQPVKFADSEKGIIRLFRDCHLLQPYILIDRDASVEAVFTLEKRPNEDKIQELLNTFQTNNSYQSAWYSFKFKPDQLEYWLPANGTNDRLTILCAGFINHVIQWNYELKNAYERSSTSQELFIKTLLNISSHVFKTTIKSDFISELESIIDDDNRELLSPLLNNSWHLFVLTGLINLLIKIRNPDEFKKTALNDGLLSHEFTPWDIEEKVTTFNTTLFRRKGLLVRLDDIVNVPIPHPNIKIYGLNFTKHLIRCFISTFLENVEVHGFFEEIDNSEVCNVTITLQDNEWTIKNRAKEKFEIKGNKLTGNLLLLKELIERTGAGSVFIECEEENYEYFFVLKIKTLNHETA